MALSCYNAAHPNQKLDHDGRKVMNNPLSGWLHLNRKMTTNSPMTSSPFIRRIEIKSLSQGWR